ncbi:hypothetical protein [Shewanella surugensis]|uniref:Lipoprotein n=1 Tax=Shewanella surugensis TaxID=212020 RepID=A0ABT0LI54_9GAMM|nr:hypothetical protein [Shewanella surugensis]MCL1127387.1 hypothetical protein [Shewanella surugensis]
MRIIIIMAIFLLSGCSSGVVKMERDSYMLSEKAGGCGFATGSGQEAEAYKKANKFCSKKGQQVETIYVAAKDGIPFVRCASAQLKFKCVQ